MAAPKDPSAGSIRPWGPVARAPYRVVMSENLGDHLVPPVYPGQWESDVVLSDGGTLHVRPVRPDDVEEMEALLARTSPESVYFRFFSPVRTLSRPAVERFATVDYVDRMAFVVEDDGRLVAVARYERTPGSDEAEVAFLIEDRHHGRGLGTLLLEHLAAAGRAHGISRFVADTLAENQKMLGVFRNAGFAMTTSTDGAVVTVRFPLDETPSVARAIEEREHRSEARSVARVLAPTSIAVVGASRQPGSIGHEIFRNLIAGGFTGPVYPVHPSARSIAGVRAYPRLDDVPDDVDLVIVVVPADAVMDVLRSCPAKNVHGVVIISNGFAESDAEGRRAEHEIVAFALRHGIRVIGPNCLGIVNTASTMSMNATFAPVRPVPGRVALMSQSGAIGIAALQQAAASGLGLSSFVSVGNKADVSGNDLLQHWEDDPETAVIMLYLESFGNPRKFARIARRVARTKPIVAVKAGRSTAGNRAAASHTASAATSDVAVDALFHQTGVIRVDTLGELFDTARLLSTQPVPTGRRVAIVGNSGGPMILAADACAAGALLVPELGPETQVALRAFLPPTAAVRNPVDLVAAASAAQFEQAVRILLGDPEIDALVAVYTPPIVTRTEDILAAVSRGASSARPDVPVLAVVLSGEHPNSDAAGSVPVYPLPEPAIRALARAADHGAWRDAPVGHSEPVDRDALRSARVIVDAVLTEHPDGTWLDLERSRALLGCFGIPVIESRTAETTAEVVAAAQAIGFPVALKAANPQLVHKTDVGGVRLGLLGEAAAEQAYTEMLAALGDRLGGVLVQPMAGSGVETIVGVVNDQSFGPLVMFGLGGIATELLGDRQFRILPLSNVDATALVTSLRASPLLFGYRGTAPVDVAALEALLVGVAQFAEHVPELAELDLNPVIARPDGVLALDVKLRLLPARPRPELAVRRLD